MHNKDEIIANVCLGSRKDTREAVVAARKAFAGWSGTSAYLRGQILYRIAEMLEGRSEQFVAELVKQGLTKAKARTEVAVSIDRLVYYAGWTDKFQQVFSSVNPVSSAHFNFTVPEPTGVVTIIAPAESGLLGLVSNIAAAIAGGHPRVALAHYSMPFSANRVPDGLHHGDVAAGLGTYPPASWAELTEQFAAHMDVNAIVYCDGDAAVDREIQLHAANNIKRVVRRTGIDWSTEKGQGPYFIRDTQEFKTTWHPVGG